MGELDTPAAPAVPVAGGRYGAGAAGAPSAGAARGWARRLSGAGAARQVALTWEEENIWGGREGGERRSKGRRRPPTPPEGEHYTAPGPGLTPGIPGSGRWRPRLSDISSVSAGGAREDRAESKVGGPPESGRATEGLACDRPQGKSPHSRAR